MTLANSTQEPDGKLHTRIFTGTQLWSWQIHAPTLLQQTMAACVLSRPPSPPSLFDKAALHVWHVLVTTTTITASMEPAAARIGGGLPGSGLASTQTRIRYLGVAGSMVRDIHYIVSACLG